MNYEDFIKNLNKKYTVEIFSEDCKVVRVEEEIHIAVEINGKQVDLENSGESVYQFDRNGNLVYQNIFDKEENERDLKLNIQALTLRGMIGENDDAVFKIEGNKLVRTKICKS